MTKDRSYHPGGDCRCSLKHRRIVRRYMGYGYCANCNKLTPTKRTRIRR